MASTTRRDIASAYLAAFTKLASWLVVSALTFRRLGPDAFALLALVRSTIGLLNYTSFGLAPALVYYLAKSGIAALPAMPLEATPATPSVLPYATPAKSEPFSPHQAQRPYTTGVVTAFVLFLVGMIALYAVGSHATHWLNIPGSLNLAAEGLIVTMGLGILVRILSDPSGAALQTFGRITLDNTLLAATDVIWVATFTLSLENGSTVDQAGTTFLLANVFLLLARYAFTHRVLPLSFGRTSVDLPLAHSLLSFGLLVTLAQLADYLYAPTDFLLINHLLSTKDLTAYVPAVQIDAALLLLVTSLATVLLPKAAIAHARNDSQALRRYYIQGTLASTALLVLASTITYFAAPLLLRAWLHDIPPGTLAILPLVLLHTTIGGSSAVGRSILLAAGRVKPFTTSVLLAGLLNVACSYLLARYTNLGLTGIVIGTLIAVTFRCMIWLPWYTLHCLSRTKKFQF